MFLDFNLNTLANWIQTIDGAISIITAIVGLARAIRAIARRLRRKRAERRQQLTKRRSRRSGHTRSSRTQKVVDERQDACFARFYAFLEHGPWRMISAGVCPVPRMIFS